jgi:hypothetical protein
MWIRIPGLAPAEAAELILDSAPTTSPPRLGIPDARGPARLHDLPTWLEVTFQSMQVALQVISTVIAVRALKVSGNLSGVGAKTLDRGASTDDVTAILGALQRDDRDGEGDG